MAKSIHMGNDEGTSVVGALTASLAALALTTAACTAPTAERGESAPTATGATAVADEAGRDTGPPAVALPQVEPGPREATPSALQSPTAAGLPTPLVDPGDLVSGGPPPDSIPALDRPTFQRTSDVHWVDETEQVLVVDVAGEARAYPVQILTFHEIVNDTVGGVPVAVTYCPLCASGVAFDRRVADRVLSFGTSGRLYLSDLVMFDRQTESLWPQLEGRAVAGALTGTELSVLPAVMLSWDQWQAAHPEGWVLSRQTGHRRPYGSNPYPRYDDKNSVPMFPTGGVDVRMEWFKQPVVGIEIDGDAVAIDVEALRRVGVREIVVGGRTVTVWWLPGARSSLDGLAVGEGREVGTTAAFDPSLDGRLLTFRSADGVVVDDQTGSVWDGLGRAVSGPAAGARLEPVRHVSTFWFAWSGFHEDTRVVR